MRSQRANALAVALAKSLSRRYSTYSPVRAISRAALTSAESDARSGVCYQLVEDLAIAGQDAIETKLHVAFAGTGRRLRRCREHSLPAGRRGRVHAPGQFRGCGLDRTECDLGVSPVGCFSLLAYPVQIGLGDIDDDQDA